MWELFKEEFKITAVEEALLLGFENKTTYRALYRILSELYELECVRANILMTFIVQRRSYKPCARKSRGAPARLGAQWFLVEQPCAMSLGDELRHALSKQIVDIEHGGTIVYEPTLPTKASLELCHIGSMVLVD